MLVEIFYHIDEFCKLLKKEAAMSKLIGERKQRDRESTLSLSELMTIAIYYHHSGYKTFQDYYCKHVLVYMRNDFKDLISYSRFVELKETYILPLALFIRLNSMGNCTGTSFIDSFAMKVSHNKRIHSHKVFKGHAARGKTSVDWFYGFKIHFSINQHGDIISFKITPGNVADNDHEVIMGLSKDLFGKLFGDKGYVVNENLLKMLYSKGIHLITKLRKNMKNKLLELEDKLLLRKRGVIDSVIGILKNSLSIEHTRHRSPINFIAHVMSSLAAYIFYKDKPTIATIPMIN